MDTKEQKAKFCRSVAVNCNFRDMDNIRDVYYAIVRTIMQECRADGKILLPDFGTMKLKTRKSKRIRNINTGELSYSDEYQLMHFVMSQMLKNHINHK